MSLLGTCEEPNSCQIGSNHCFVDQIFRQKMTKGIDEGQKGHNVKGLILKVKCTKKAQRARQESPHSKCSPMNFSHYKTKATFSR